MTFDAEYVAKLNNEIVSLLKARTIAQEACKEAEKRGALKIVKELRELMANDPVGRSLPNVWLKKAINTIEARLKGES